MPMDDDEIKTHVAPYELQYRPDNSFGQEWVAEDTRLREHGWAIRSFGATPEAAFANLDESRVMTIEVNNQQGRASITIRSGSETWRSDGDVASSDLLGLPAIIERALREFVQGLANRDLDHSRHSLRMSEEIGGGA